MVKRILIHTAFSVVLLVAASINMASSCSCMMSHPQTHACRADFVIVARVKKVFTHDGMSRVYKVKIKREFKMSEKASVVLKAGRLVTGGSSSTCGVQLEPEVTYLITGKVLAGQAHVNLCNYITNWNDLTVRQKKGFRLLYRQGCLCEIIDCPWWKQCPRDRLEADACLWESSVFSDASLPDCQSKHGICMKTPSGNCGWSTDKKYRECMKERRRMRDERRRNEP
ncbi:tissue inhibitor of metalloproteases isoform X2 [Zootermopsis nevadensis]|uniref:Metalloproteinase inhibitor 3 n=2 Tax=Zootermopsis nevadensis TaxID=136037 RepID=A0A067RNW2_ZOONE|nr:tissue inhibitor of metalloproteases isoform X2 [Zootermopsis nevadensis]XP_021913974.1 tissue inhibitor of metalloproteases isoform X2 [Zootermopsis nevadensis]KDR22300.1 Metalloproteinase inhibitor 3 [Zootermopsis nevadensis]